MARNVGGTSSSSSPHTQIAGKGGSTSKTQSTGVYVGIVKDNFDTFRMGRIRVFIPELGGREEDEANWHIMNYVSPFAGNTSIKNGQFDSQQEADAQTSYGFWFPSVDVGNEVVCAFNAGNNSFGIWFGCLFGQNMNNMVPGSPSNIIHQDPLPGNIPPPAVEYSKRDRGNSPDNTTRPILTELTDALAKQGTWKDTARGVTNAGARRESPSTVMGMRTRAGWQWVFDEGNTNNYMRFRGPKGSQILVNETYGFIYFINRDGTVWIEMQQDGFLDIYAKQSINVHSEIDINFRADRDVNIEAGRDVQIKAVGTSVPGPGAAPGDVKIEAVNEAHIYSGKGIYETSEQIHRYGTNLIHDFAGNVINHEAGSHINQSAAKIDHNTDCAGASTPAIQNTLTDHPDNIKVLKSNNSRVPENEPWQPHNIFEPNTQLSHPELKQGSGQLPPSQGGPPPTSTTPSTLDQPAQRQKPTTQPVASQADLAPQPAQPPEEEAQGVGGEQQPIAEEESIPNIWNSAPVQDIRSYILDNQGLEFMTTINNFCPYALGNTRIPSKFEFGYFKHVDENFINRFPQGLTEIQARDLYQKEYIDRVVMPLIRRSNISVQVPQQMFTALTRLVAKTHQVPSNLVSIINRIKPTTLQTNPVFEELKTAWKAVKFDLPLDAQNLLDFEFPEESLANRVSEISLWADTNYPWKSIEDTFNLRTDKIFNGVRTAARQHAALARSDLQKQQIEYSLYRMGFNIYDEAEPIAREFQFDRKFKLQVLNDFGRVPPQYLLPNDQVFGEQDNEVLTLTAFGEAGGDSPEAVQAVINVIMNRFNFNKDLKRSGQKVLSQWSNDPITISSVCKARDQRSNYGQFSCWNPLTGPYGGNKLIQGGTPKSRIEELRKGRYKNVITKIEDMVKLALDQSLEDISQESTYYYLNDQDYETITGIPRWVERGIDAGDVVYTVEIGRFTFLRSVSGGYISA